MSALIPMVIENTPRGERAMDIPAILLQQRIITLAGPFNDAMAYSVAQQILYLDSINDQDITLRIDSPGGSVHAGLTIVSAMDQARSDIITEVQGMAASMGCYIASRGTPGKRYCHRLSSIMAHQVSAGEQGHVADMRAGMAHTEDLNDILMSEIAMSCGVPFEKFMADQDRDAWYIGTQARDYGFVDAVIGVDIGKIDPRFVEVVPEEKRKVRKPRVPAKAKPKAE